MKKYIVNIPEQYFVMEDWFTPTPSEIYERMQKTVIEKPEIKPGETVKYQDEEWVFIGDSCDGLAAILQNATTYEPACIDWDVLIKHIGGAGDES